MTVLLYILLSLTVCILLVPLKAMGQETEEVYVRSFDGAYIHAIFRLPRGEGPHPAIMFIHGGIGGARQRPGPAAYVQAHFLANRYAILEVDYRRYHFGDEELEDIVACYRYLKSRSEVDRSRIGVIGGSHGGYLALMLATRERPTAIVSFAGLVDIEGMFHKNAQELAPDVYGNFEWREKRFHQGKSIREESELMDKGQLGPPPRRPERSAGEHVTKDLASRWGEDVEIYRRYSPKEQYRLIESPVLYVVGSEDRLRTAGKDLVDSLKALGRTAEYSEHPGMAHGFYWGGRPDAEGSIPEEFYRSLKRSTDFMRKWVKERGMPPKEPQDN